MWQHSVTNIPDITSEFSTHIITIEGTETYEMFQYINEPRI